MSGVFDDMVLRQQEEAARQQAARSARLYNPDGSAKANDYHAPSLPASAFPAVTVAGGRELIVHRGQLLQVAAQMRSDLHSLRTALQRLAAVGDAGVTLQGWPTADALGSNLRSAYEGITQLYRELNAAYETVIANIHATEANYAQAESSTVAAVHGTGAGPVGAGSPAA